jgi:hypothetical protein
MTTLVRAGALFGALSLAACAACAACSENPDDALSLSRREEDRPLKLGERFPDAAETTIIGATAGKVRRDSGELVTCTDSGIVFKDEEGTGADRVMTPRLELRLRRLARAVVQRWPDSRLRVTEAWDERGEHGENSAHYEGRAADLTTEPKDAKKLGPLSRMAVHAGLDWVFYEDDTHVHVSVRRGSP